MISVVFILSSIVLSLLIYLFWKQNLSSFGKKINKFPGPPTYPILGSVYVLWETQVGIFRIFRELASTYANTYNLWSAQIAVLNIVTAEDAEVLLTNPRSLEKSILYDFLSHWLGRGLLTSTGLKWNCRRRLLTNSFHFNILRKYVVTFGEHAQKLVEDLKKECKKPYINVTPVISVAALQVICETAMGTTLDLKDKNQQKYFQAIYDMAPVLVHRIVSPWYYNNFTWNLCPTGWKQRNIIKVLHSFTRNVIKKREETVDDTTLKECIEDDGSTKKRMAMLDLLISAKRNQGSIDTEGIREEVDTFMFEGHDTTTAALSFALMILANHKKHQQKIVEELKEIFGDSDRAATYEDLQKMNYLELCLKESLRLFPSVPLVSRIISENMQFSTCVAPAGSTAIVHIYDIHRNPKYFPNPEKFDPSRFLPENSKDRHPFAYIPFSAGPRNCIGQKFAMLEMKSLLSAVLRNFILEPISTPENTIMKADIVLRSANDINVRFILRESINNDIK